MSKLDLKSDYLSKLGISKMLENLYEKYNKESQYATLIDKTKEYIIKQNFTDKDKINIINALELQICNSYRFDAINLVGIPFFSALIGGFLVMITDKVFDINTKNAMSDAIISGIACMFLMSLSFIGVYLLFKLLKEHGVIKTEDYRKKMFLRECVNLLK